MQSNWPSQLDDKSKRAADDLAKNRGADFDLDYVKAMVEGHQDLTATLESRLDLQALAELEGGCCGPCPRQGTPQPKERDA